MIINGTLYRYYSFYTNTKKAFYPPIEKLQLPYELKVIINEFWVLGMLQHVNTFSYKFQLTKESKWLESLRSRLEFLQQFDITTNVALNNPIRFNPFFYTHIDDLVKDANRKIELPNDDDF